MPIYSFQCDQCKTLFEVRASYQEKEHGLKLVCPKCQSKDAHQVLTSATVVSSHSDNSSSCCGPNSGFGCCG